MFTSYRRVIPVCAALAALGAPLLAQDANSALETAKQQLACGVGTPVSASYQPDGALRVVCRSPGAAAVTQAATGLPATGLSAGLVTGVVIGALALAVIANDDDATTTTTSSTGTGN